MENRSILSSVFGWLIGLAVVAVGFLNLLYIHPVPGLAYLFLSLIFLPPANAFFRDRLGFAIPLLLKIILGVAIFMFTLGVSDLGDMIDKL